MSLADLNPQQREAATYLSGPLLVLAGAGTGKTKTITHRLARIVRGGTPASRTLSVTFTNKAAREMRQRATALLKQDGLLGRAKRGGDRPVVCTFHAYCLRVLREDIHRLGYPAKFTILDRGDQEAAARTALREVKLTDGTMRPGDLLAKISTWKSHGLTPKAARADPEDDRDFLAAIAYRRYADALRAAGAVDFDDLLGLTVRLFDEYPDVLGEHRGRFDHVQVDEYQDTNAVQFRLVRRLVDGHRNLCAVGDDDQSIYGWRGAEVEHILGFATHFPDAKVVRLEENYRSAGPVLEVANRLVAHNRGRHAKELRPARRVSNPVRFRDYADELVEAEQVALEIAFLVHEKQVPPADVAILHRTGEQTRPFESELRRRKVPYEVVGGQSFFDRKEVKDLTAFLKAVDNPDDDRALLRIINVPPRGIGQTVVRATLDAAVTAGVGFWDAAEKKTADGSINARTAAALREFRGLLGEYRAKFARAAEPSATAAALVERIGYESEIDRRYDDPKQRMARSAAVDGFLQAVRDYAGDAKRPSLSGFLQEIGLGERDFGDDSKPPAGVRLMTLHAAKGLEFPRVYLVGMEEGLLPHRRSIDAGRAGIEEERRLAYVGLTRARDHLTVTRCQGRRSRGRIRPKLPSRFLMEMTGRSVPRVTPGDEPASGPGAEEPARRPSATAERRAVGEKSG